MTFGALHSEYNALRRQLAVHFSHGVMEEITVEAPKGDSDELSFLRLVAWGYVMLNETGRVPLRFLKSLPPWQLSGSILPHVGALRTWTSHNLAFDNGHDLKTMRTATVWLAEKCGTGSPNSSAQWKLCFEALVQELINVVVLAKQACDNFNDSTDGGDLIKQLKERLDRNWPAHRFDSYVERAIQTFGYEGLEVTSIRAGRIEQWRAVLVATTEDAIERVLTQRIEADVLDFMRNALPAPAEEIAQLLCFDEKADLAAALLVLREFGPKSSQEVIQSLRALSNTTQNSIDSS